MNVISKDKIPQLTPSYKQAFLSQMDEFLENINMPHAPLPPQGLYTGTVHSRIQKLCESKMNALHLHTHCEWNWQGETTA